MRRPGCSEQGMVLPLVLILVTCIIILAISFLAMFNARARLNTSNIHNNTAGYVAEVGLNQYIWNLNQNDNFWQSNPILAGYYADANGYYYVTAAPPNSPANPYLTLSCTGWLAKDPNNKYSFTAQVVKRTFTQFVWCTNWELTVPSSGTPKPNDQNSWIWWVTGDRSHGPMFTNGVYYFRGTPTFDDLVEYVGNGATRFNNSTNPPTPLCYFDTGSAPNFRMQPPPEPDLVQTMSFPTSNSDLLTWSNPKRGGLYFNGRTSIFLQGTTIRVVNYDCNQFIMDGLTPKQPLQANPNGNSWVTATYPLPANGVIYVDGAQDADYSANNYSSSSGGEAKFNPTLGNVFVSGSLQGKLTIAAANNIYITGADPTSAPPADPHQSGGVTYATTTFDADGNVVNLGSDDMLGLVTNNYVMILRYGWPRQSTQSPYCYSLNDYSPNNVNVDAAIMAVNYSWQYEGWKDQTNPQGAINLEGSIIQNFRGPVGQSSGNTRLCGYLKNYYHDPRMNTENPPHFLQPTTSGWGVLTWRRSEPPPITWTQVTGISVTSQGGATSVYAGQTLQMLATVTPPNATIKTFTWSVANSGGANATIDSNTGLLNAGTHNGTVVVTATSQDVAKLSASMSITISIIPVASVTVTAQSGATSMLAGKTLQMSAMVLPEDASIKTVTWSIVNSGGASAAIDPNTGLLTAGAEAGTVTATATSTDGYAWSAPYYVTITVGVSGITVAGYGGATSVLCGSGYTLQMDATVTPSNANQTVTWSVTNSGGTNATISSTGLLSAGTIGGMVKVTATATDGSGVSRSTDIIIFVPVTGITIAGQGGNSVRHSSTYTTRTLLINATVTPLNATNKTVTWSVDDPGVTGTTINANSGLLTAGYNTGTVTVKAKSTDGTNISSVPLTITITN